MRTDSDLLRRYLDHADQGAFAELVARHANLVYSVGLHHARSAHRADEVVQSVFIDVARKARPLSERSDLAGWLFTAARFAAIKIVRGEARRGAWERRCVVEEESVRLSDGAPAAAGREDSLSALVLEELNSLGERDRTALLLRFWENRTWDEIGRATANSAEGARKRVERALDGIGKGLRRRGIQSTAAATAAAMGGSLFAAPPVTVSAAIAGAVAAGAPSAVASLVAFMGTSGKGLIAATLVATLAVGTALYLNWKAVSAEALLATQRRQCERLIAMNTASRRRPESLQTVGPKPAQPPPNLAKPEDPVKLRAMTIDFLRSDPDARRMSEELSLRCYAYAYARFAKERHLSEADAARLFALLADHSPRYVASFLVGGDTDSDAAIRASGLLAILGPDGVEAFEAYTKARQQRSLVDFHVGELVAADPSIGAVAAQLERALGPGSAGEDQALRDEAIRTQGSPADDTQGDYLYRAEKTVGTLLTPHQMELYRLLEAQVTGKEAGS